MADPYASALRTPARYEPDAPPASVRTVPFDYVVTFALTGEPGSVKQNVINVSTVGTFVVTSIGYSLLKQETVEPVTANDPERLPTPPVPVVVPPAAPPIIIRAAPAAEAGEAAEAAGPAGEDDGDAEASAADSFKILGAPGAEVRILVNGAGLPDGTRRLDAEGRLFLGPKGLPLGERDTLVVSDLTNGRSSPTLLLDRSASTEAPVIAPQFGPELPLAGATAFSLAGTPGGDVDAAVYGAGDVATPRLQGVVSIPPEDDPVAGVEAGRLQVDLQTLMTGEAFARSRRKRKLKTDKELEAARAAVEAGEEEPPRLQAGDTLVLRNVSNNVSASHTLASGVLDLSLASLPVRALRQGFRLDATLLRRLENEVPVPPEEQAQPFALCGSAPEDVSFLYAIIDNGTGRALQSEPIHNIAGLGIANGDRPFRTYPRPIIFEPRSVILFQVQEISGGPGTLYIVLQGYKVIGTGRRRLAE